MGEQDVSAALDGGCTCRAVRYRMTSRPLFVHCCHCRWCQRETGSAVRAQRHDRGRPRRAAGGRAGDRATRRRNSGKGQKIARCPTCRIALWSNYAGAGDAVRFVRVGTLDEPDRLPPDIHIFTASKQPWVILPPDTPAVPEYYDRRQHWPAESLERMRVLRERAP